MESRMISVRLEKLVVISVLKGFYQEQLSSASQSGEDRNLADVSLVIEFRVWWFMKTNVFGHK